MKAGSTFTLLVCVVYVSVMAASCVPDSAQDGEWTRVSDHTYRAVNQDGSVSIRQFGVAARAVHDAFFAAQPPYAARPNGPSADDAELEPPAGHDGAGAISELIDAGDSGGGGTPSGPCGIDYSISHRAYYLGVGAAGLMVLVQSSATQSLFSPTPVITSITHVDSGWVSPTAAAGNQTASSSSYTETQLPHNSIGNLVSSSTTWSDSSHFQRPDLCTAKAFTSITVLYGSGSTCVISQTTFFPACVAVL